MASVLNENPYMNNTFDNLVNPVQPVNKPPESYTPEEIGWMSLTEWSVFVNNGLWQPRDFDLVIIELLEAAIQGKVSKILLSVPSRHGKSTLISKNLASYFLSYYPNDKVILSAYSQRLASEFGGQVKDIINHYGDYSPYKVRLSTDSRAKNKFNIANYQGQMLAVGAAGSIMGFGAGLFIVDDPIKNVADAESEVKQQNLREWFQGVVKSRLEKRKDGKPPLICNRSKIARSRPTRNHQIHRTNNGCSNSNQNIRTGWKYTSRHLGRLKHSCNLHRPINRCSRKTKK